MANTSLEPDPTHYIDTPLKKFYGVEERVISPHIFFFVAILSIVGMALI